MMTTKALGDRSQFDSDRKGDKTPSVNPTLLCHIVFAALGMLMLTAAGFKAYEACQYPMSVSDLSETMVLVWFESLLGSWLLFGIRSAWTLRVAAACFAAFASVSAYKSLAGASSCGCFGTLQVDPAITLVIDVAAVGLLLICRSGVETFSESKLRHVTPAVATLATILFVSAISVALYRQSQFAQSDSTTMLGELIVLDPELWTGKQWPLLDQPGLPHRLASREWDILLFRHDCHVCHDVMLEMEQVLLANDDRQRIALIGVDEPNEDVQTARLQKLGCLLSYLPQDREWFATTPLRVRLRDGVCVSASVIKTWE